MNDTHQVLRLPLWIDMQIPQRKNSRPLGLGGSTEQPKNMKRLLELRVSGKEGQASDHLGEDATDGPDVDPGGVMCGCRRTQRYPSSNCKGIKPLPGLPIIPATSTWPAT
jgi:hypothetical protein